MYALLINMLLMRSKINVLWLGGLPNNVIIQMVYFQKCLSCYEMAWFGLSNSIHLAGIKYILIFTSR